MICRSTVNMYTLKGSLIIKTHLGCAPLSSVKQPKALAGALDPNPEDLNQTCRK